LHPKILECGQDGFSEQPPVPPAINRGSLNQVLDLALRFMPASTPCILWRL